MSGKELTEEQRRAIGRGLCPDCQHRGFVLGPRGGASINIECGNRECKARFNVAAHPFDCTMIVFGQRIAKRSEGGSRWGMRPDA